MKRSLIALAIVSTSVFAQTAEPWSLFPGKPAIYDPSKGPLPADQRYMMTRAGAEAAKYEAMNPGAVVAQATPIPHPYALPQGQARTVVKAPAWFVNLPEDTADMTFAVGTATSTDEQMAYDKARMAAERKLVEQMYSRISTQTNSYKADQGSAMIENYQQVTRKNARGELSGAQRVDSQVTHDGQFYKVYVLLRLPLGTANTMQTKRDQTRLQQEAEIRSNAAERNMDSNEARDQKREQDAKQELESRLNQPNKNVPATVPTSTGEVKLLDVDNAEYKKKRDDALQKPNAVIGQTVVR